MKRFALLLVSFALPALAEFTPAKWVVPNSQPRTYGEPPLRTGNAAASVVAALEATTDEDIAALRQYNVSGATPARVGVVRPLAGVIMAKRGIRASSNEPWRWRAQVRVANGHSLRLQLTNVNAPAGTTFWVYGISGAAYGFDASLAHEGTLWTPSVDGDTILIEFETTSDAAPFAIGAVADIRPFAEVIPTDSSCIKDAQCYTGLDDLGTAIAHMRYVSGSSVFICTGGLINDMAGSGTPYFLTANHCIATQAEAASLETYWDYKTAACGGAIPPKGAKNSGSSLLATNAVTDVTLLKLNSIPGRRLFLGWTTVAPETGTTLYRISHPEGQPQRFSTATVTAGGATCTGWPRPNFVYSTHVIGTSAGGSSGSPVFTNEGAIVGQLAGACGIEPDNPCNHENKTVDGAFAASYSVLEPFLNPGVTNGCTPCTPNGKTACMMDGRFKVTVTWKDHSAKLQGEGSILTFNDNRPEMNPQYGTMSQTTFFSMYESAPNSIELMVRMLRGLNINNKFWVFMTGFSPNEYVVTVTDTQTCTTWTRTNASGNFSIVADYDAFPF